MNRSTHGFTLVELLVVITIIVILITMLTPAVEKAMELAKRAVCATNLHNWGAAHAQYYMDNKRQLPEPARMWADASHGNDGWVYPNNPWIWTQADKAGKLGEISAQMYASYNGALSYSSIPTRGVTAPDPIGVGTVTTDGPGTGATVSRLFLCPSNLRYDSRYDRNNEAAQNPPGGSTDPTDINSVGGNAVDSQYSYFARVSKYKVTSGGAIRAPWSDELVDKDLGGGRLLMNCTVKLDGGEWHANGSDYSHGELPDGGYPKIAGSNQLYGDGGVIWYDGRVFKTDSPAMFNSGGVGGAANAGDATDIPHYINGAGVYGRNTYAPYFLYAR